jgi:thioredoxin 1
MNTQTLNQLTFDSTIAKVNIGESSELAARFGIAAVPTLIVFKDGQPVRTLRGVQSWQDIAKTLAAVSME